MAVPWSNTDGRAECGDAVPVPSLGADGVGHAVAFVRGTVSRAASTVIVTEAGPTLRSGPESDTGAVTGIAAGVTAGQRSVCRRRRGLNAAFEVDESRFVVDIDPDAVSAAH